MDAEARLQAVRKLLAEPFASYELTPRERAVIRLAAKGMQPAEIGGRLGKSKFTVYAQLKSGCDKLGTTPDGLSAKLIRDVERALATRPAPRKGRADAQG